MSEVLSEERVGGFVANLPHPRRMASPHFVTPLTVAERMSRSVRVCSSTATLRSAAELIWDHDYRAVPVVDFSAGRLEGVLTEARICAAARAARKPLAAIGVRAAVQTLPFDLYPDDPVEAAIELMKRAETAQVPVLYRTGYVCGMISLEDARAPRFRRSRR